MKRLFDLSLAAGLLILSPILLVLMLLIRLKLGSPVFFTQTRQGKYGKPFRMVKFRTMTNVRGLDGEFLSDADRLLPFGCFMRASSCS